jgi:multisubunit Na+/H+ antiporter MnhB subunit
MNSEVFRNIAGRLPFILTLISLAVLFRGHNKPGGGFIGGIIAAIPFVLYGLAFSVEKLNKKLFLSPLKFIVLGLFLASSALLFPMLIGDDAFSGIWLEPFYAEGIKIAIGTPLMFDVGVYFLVFGVIITIFSLIIEQLKWS